MKNLLFLLLAIVILISCQNEFQKEVIPEEEPEVIDNPILKLINEYRTKDYVDIFYGVTYPAKNALVWDYDLEKVSKIQADYMYENDNWYIVWKDGTDLNKRFEMANCNYSPRVECYIKMSTSNCSKASAIKILFKNKCNILMDEKYNIVAVTQTGKYWSIVLANKPISISVPSMPKH